MPSVGRRKTRAMDDPVPEKFGHIEWHYATGDSKALAELEERIAEAGRKRSLITYSDLVCGRDL